MKHDQQARILQWCTFVFLLQNFAWIHHLQMCVTQFKCNNFILQKLDALE